MPQKRGHAPAMMKKPEVLQKSQRFAVFPTGIPSVFFLTSRGICAIL